MSRKPKMTLSLAYAIGRDAGAKSARAGGRVTWNEDDWNAASSATIKALELIETPN